MQSPLVPLNLWANAITVARDDQSLSEPLDPSHTQAHRNPLSRLLRRDVLLSFSLLYIFLPYIVFAFGWLKVQWSIFFAPLIVLSVWRTLHETTSGLNRLRQLPPL